jgi:hypothetical protein
METRVQLVLKVSREVQETLVGQELLDYKV